jgi:uncharacterized cupredoxin-like copper-binding protein
MAAFTAAAFAHGAAQSGDAPYGRPGDPKHVDRSVTIEARDFAFDTSELTFAAGETVKFVVVNKGRHKHELTIGDAAEQTKHRDAMSKMSDMAHSEDGGDMPGNAVHVAPGETRELVWTFTRAGKLEFACNYPGHADLGMEGKITVQ